MKSDLSQQTFEGTSSPNIYLGMFLIATATLALELAFTRLLSVTTWYYLAFFAVSIALLGMTAGSVTVYLKPKWFTPERIGASAGKACLGYAAVIPFTTWILCVIPVTATSSPKDLLSLITLSVVSLLPFYFAGIAISAVITKAALPIGNLYSSDLAGASLGCLLVLWGMGVFDAPSLILLCACTGVTAAISFAWGSWSLRFRALALSLLCILVVLVSVTALTPYGLHPRVVKGRKPGSLVPLFEKWNSFSRVVIYEGRLTNAQYWAASRRAPAGLMVYQHRMDIDGEAATTVRRFESLEDIAHLRYDVTNIAYYLRHTGGACIIGVGGGRDIQSAILFGHEKITGIEINPIFIDLLKHRFRKLAGIAGHRGVTLIVDEARSYLSRTQERFSLIQMSLTDTWAATGAGAFTLSENALYTVEAWNIFMDRLSDEGIFTVSRWYDPEALGETGRVLSLAVAALKRAGNRVPADHIAMVVKGSVSTVIVGREPLREVDIAVLRGACDDLEFELVLYPGKLPRHPVLRRVLEGEPLSRMDEVAATAWLSYDPPTDERPYFFNMVKCNKAITSLWPRSELQGNGVSGIVHGNIVAMRFLTMLILCLLLLSVVTVVFPLMLVGRGEARVVGHSRLLWSGAAYFCLIGAGFMFVEIALIQRLSVFLGHPMYALGILLFTIIGSAGVGSRLSDRLPLTGGRGVYVYPVIVVLAILAIRFALPIVGSTLVSASMPVKILVSISVCMPLGFLLGIAFPTGMRLVRVTRAAETPWYWALNGVFGVLCAALTVFISICSGISTSLYVAALCYGLLVICLPGILRAADAAQKSLH